jgi:protein TonB
MLGRWIRLETEKSCDERVLELTGHPDTYAQGILKVVHLALGLPPPSLVGAITPPVVSRVQNILRNGHHCDRRWLRCTALAAGVFLLALGGNTGSRASTPEKPASQTPSRSRGLLESFSLLPGQPSFLPSAIISDLAASQNPPWAGPEIPVAPQAGTTPDIIPEAETSAAEVFAGADSPVVEALAKSDPPAQGSEANPAELTTEDSTVAPAADPVAAPALGYAADSLLLDSMLAQGSIASSSATTDNPATFGPTGPIVAAAAEMMTQPDPAKVYDHVEVDTLPIALAPVKADYPGSLKRAGIEGAATIAFIVDAGGNVREAHSIKPTDRLSAEAAVNAVKQLKFLPGLKNGLPVATSMELPFNFHIRSGAVAVPALLTTVTAGPAGKPALLRPSRPVSQTRNDNVTSYSLSDLDVIPVATYQVEPVYPADLKRAGVSGRATVSCVVDAKGNVKSVRPVDSTDTRFEAAALNAVGKWKFQPGVRDGEAVPSLVVVPFTFNLSNRY